MDKQWLKKLTRLKEPSQRDFVAHFREELVRRDLRSLRPPIRFQLLTRKDPRETFNLGSGKSLAICLRQTFYIYKELKPSCLLNSQQKLDVNRLARLNRSGQLNCVRRRIRIEAPT